MEEYKISYTLCEKYLNQGIRKENKKKNNINELIKHALPGVGRAHFFIHGSKFDIVSLPGKTLHKVQTFIITDRKSNI